MPADGGAPLLDVRGLKKQFGGLAALAGVDLSVRRGETLGVIGPNGAGKTTLVSCIGGSIRPTAGTIAWKGGDITSAPSHARGRAGIARTFQVVKPLKQLSVWDNVAVGAMFGAGGRGRSTAEAHAHAEAIVRRVGLGARIDHRAADLTLPDLKRLELARALAMDPELLLLDEVMAGLNPREVELAMDLIRSIAASGTTLLVVEHVMKAIVGISDRVVVLHHGRTIADGTPREVMERTEVIDAYLGRRYAQRVKPT